MEGVRKMPLTCLAPFSRLSLEQAEEFAFCLSKEWKASLFLLPGIGSPPSPPNGS